MSTPMHAAATFVLAILFLLVFAGRVRISPRSLRSP
jgi:hypothetical protein